MAELKTLIWGRNKATTSPQLLANQIAATGQFTPILVWKEGNVIVDGYRRAEAWPLLSGDLRTALGTDGRPPIQYVSLESLADALALRFSANDGVDWNLNARGVTLLRNTTLRAAIKKDGDERILAGKKSAYRADAYTALANGANGKGKPKICRDRLYKLDTILKGLPNEKDSEQLLAQVCGGDVSVNQAFKRVREFQQNQIAKAALKVELSHVAGVDTVICGDAAETLSTIGDGEIQLTVTSPPYPHPTLYEKYGIPYPGYKAWLQIMRNVFQETYRVSESGAYCCVNLADTFVMKGEGKGEDAKRRKVADDFIRVMEKIGWIYLDRVVWYKQNCSTSHPMIGGPKSWRHDLAWEYVLVFRKSGDRVTGGQVTITDKERHALLFGGLWDFAPEAAKHGPCDFAFPEELPYRCIQLYSFVGDNVLDPFFGSGTSGAVAKKLNRHYLGIDFRENVAKYAFARCESVKAGDEVKRSPSILDSMALARAERMIQKLGLSESQALALKQLMKTEKNKISSTFSSAAWHDFGKSEETTAAAE